MPRYDARKAEEFWSQRVRSTDELAAVLSYNLPTYVNEAYSRWELSTVMRCLGKISGKRVLDLACGVGRVTIPIAKRGAFVTAADNSQEMLDRCKKNVLLSRVSNKVTFAKVNATSLDFAEAEFDVVTCLGLMEHLPTKERERVVEGIARVTKARGRVFLVLNNHHSVFLPQESHYAATKQRSDGYFCGLVDKGALIDIFVHRGFVCRSLGNNLLQSVAKHSLRTHMRNRRSGALLRRFFQVCADVDIALDEKGEFDETFCDQFILVAEKK